MTPHKTLLESNVLVYPCNLVFIIVFPSPYPKSLTSLFTLILPHMIVDIDECVSANGGCEQRCNNTIGSFFCDCFNGYNLDEDQFNCNGM